MTTRFHWHPTTRLIGDDPDIARLRDRVLAGHGVQIGPAGLIDGEQDPTVLLCATSGSSGTPKVIRRSPASWQASFVINARHLDLGPDSTVAVAGTLASSLTLYAVLEAAHLGAAILSVQGQRPDRQAMALQGATVLYLTPVQLGAICAHAAGPLTSVRHIMVGGGRLDDTTVQAAARTFPAARLTQFYGAAETSFITWTDADTPTGSVGRSYPGVNLHLDPDGTIWVRSPYLSDGYAQGDSPHTRWRDGWLTVGEVGWQDAAGHLFLTGRAGRTVTIADHSVSLDAVEAVLADLTGQPAAVVALPDPQRGARLVALICAGVGGLRSACRDRLGPQGVPHRIHRVAVLPLLATGKPDYAAIAALAQAMA
ncbi:long-chain acyl-CoA synthetase [Loktanella fryxellensis]|uniref:Long-chain acyl-CoA synthetase n=1 Tax=Loktanella fryxellensis TaxID=245187 RepID=A0A1H8G7N5_9RHOB|nr:AMP-binding protein [Loktanella fryxellensis]SEN39298.1 long-chain acyl-CoA synthetase [Loktanella fryxellensis]